MEVVVQHPHEPIPREVKVLGYRNKCKTSTRHGSKNAPRRTGWLVVERTNPCEKICKRQKWVKIFPQMEVKNRKIFETTDTTFQMLHGSQAFWQWLRDPQVEVFDLYTTSQMRRNGIFTYIWPRWMGWSVVNASEITLNAPWEWNIYLHWSHKFRPCVVGTSWSPIRRIWDCCVKCWIIRIHKIWTYIYLSARSVVLDEGCMTPFCYSPRVREVLNLSKLQLWIFEMKS